MREIFESTGEIEILHPIVDESDLHERSKDEFSRHNYTVTFQPIPKSCNYQDCPLCMREIEVLKEPELVTIGKSRYDLDVIEATKRYRERRKKRRAKELEFIKTALQTIAVTNATFEALDAAMRVMRRS